MVATSSLTARNEKMTTNIHESQPRRQQRGSKLGDLCQFQNVDDKKTGLDESSSEILQGKLSERYQNEKTSNTSQFK